jgi:hypothetical protein
MPYSESLAERIRSLLDERNDIVTKKMFGSLAFMLKGNMCVGVWEFLLIARVGADAYQDALTNDYVREFDVTGRPMTGWILVEPEGVDSDRLLQVWINRAVEFVETLPAK